MPNITTQTIRGLRKKEKDIDAYLRLQACWYRKKGYTLRQIGDILDVHFGTVADWLRRMHEIGLEGRYPDTSPNVERELNPTQLDELRRDLIAGPIKCGFESEMWTPQMVIEHVRNKYNIEYKDSGMLYLLQRMGLASKKTRPRRPKAPTEEAVQGLKKGWIYNPQMPPKKTRRSNQT